jgi:hypothetical protein
MGFCAEPSSGARFGMNGSAFGGKDAPMGSRPVTWPEDGAGAAR